MINKLEINPLCKIAHLLPNAIEMVCPALFLNMIYKLPEKVVFKLYNLKRTSSRKDTPTKVYYLCAEDKKNAFMFLLIFQTMAFYMDLQGKTGI